MSYDQLDEQLRLANNDQNRWPRKLKEFAVGILGELPTSDDDKSQVVTEWLVDSKP